MNREEAVRTLKNYSAVRFQQGFLEKQLQGMHYRYDHLPPGADSRRHLAAIKRVEGVYRQNRQFMARVEECLDYLPQRQRLALWHFYVRRTDDYIDILCEKLALERTAVYLLKDKALDTFCMLSQGDFY